MIDDDYLQEPRKSRQPPWFLLTGLLFGLGIGLLISIVISPVRYVETSPASLAEEYKDDYRWLIARAYQANGDLIRAGQRLALLGDASPQAALAAHAQRMLAAGESVEDARVLANLASALVAAAEQATQTVATASPAATGPGAAEMPTPGPFQPTRTPLPTFTPRSNPSPLPSARRSSSTPVRRSATRPSRRGCSRSS
jgi:hypothetical protein